MNRKHVLKRWKVFVSMRASSVISLMKATVGSTEVDSVTLKMKFEKCFTVIIHLIDSILEPKVH